MCKHVAATLYGIGRRLDTEPELLFVLRGVNAEDLIPAGPDFTQGARPDALQGNDLGALFGIDLEEDAPGALPPILAQPRKPEAAAKKNAPRKRAANAAPGAAFAAR